MKPHHQEHPKHILKARIGFAKLDDKIALAITKRAMTMWFFWFCVALTLSALVFPQWLTQILFVSNGIQLTFLPLLGVTGALASVGQATMMELQFRHSVRTEMQLNALMKHCGMTDEEIARVHDQAENEILLEQRS